MPEIQRVLPKYLQIAGHIRDQIVRGDLGPGAEVSSERELAAAWSVARPTAARALETLRGQGLVESRPGAGTFVCDQTSVLWARERYERARRRGSMYGAAESVNLLSATVVADVPDEVRRALRLIGGAKAIRRVRLLRGAAGSPIELSTSWFAAALAEAAPGLLVLERLRGGTGKYIADVTGRMSVYARDHVAARLATHAEQVQLELPDPSAVLVYRLSVHDQNEEPVQFDEGVYPSGLWTFGQEYLLPH